MKPSSSYFLLAAIALVLAAAPADAAKGKGKGKGKPAQAGAANAAQPGQALAPYINNLEQLLALERKVPKQSRALFAEAPGRLVTLRASFVTQRGEAAEADRAKFDAAVVTCDALTQALDERTKTLGNLQASGAVGGSGKLEKGPRKDVLSQGIKGNGFAKAVGSIEERKREKAENAQAQVSAARNDEAMTAMAVNRWNQRSIELRKHITDAYAQIR